MLYREQMAVIAAHQKARPVLTVPIAKALGLRVYRLASLPTNVAAILRPDPETGSHGIYVNANQPEEERRFTIAHEIGHHVLHSNLIGPGIVEDVLLRSERLSTTVEAQANQFAANLLMPRHLLEQARGEGIVTITDLAREFRVTRDAMSVRLLGVAYTAAEDAGVEIGAVQNVSHQQYA